MRTLISPKSVCGLEDETDSECSSMAEQSLYKRQVAGSSPATPVILSASARNQTKRLANASDAGT